MNAQKKSFFSKFLIIFSAAFFVFAIFLIFLPNLLSTQVGKNIVLSFINRKIPGSVTVENASFTWLGPQVVEIVSLNDPKKTPVMAADRLIANESLFNLYFKRLPKDLKATNIHAKITTYSPGETNLQAALFTRSKPLSPPSNPVKDIVLSNGSLDFDAKENSFHFSLLGKTNSASINGAFEIQISRDRYDDKNPFKLDSGETLDIKANLENFPSGLLDQALSIVNQELSGIAFALFGDVLNLSLNQTVSEKNTFLKAFLKSSQLSGEVSASIHMENQRAGRIFLNIQSDLINASNVELLLEKNLTLTKPAQFQGRLTPETMGLFFSKNFPVQDLLIVNGSIEELNIPLQGNAQTNSFLRASLLFSPFLLKTPLNASKLDIGHLDVSLKGNPFAEISIALSCAIEDKNPLSLFSTWIGNARLAAEATAKRGKKNGFELNPLHVSLESPLTEAVFEGKVTDKGLLSFSSPVFVRYLLDLSKIQADKQESPLLIPLELNIHPTALNLMELEEHLASTGKIAGDLRIVQDLKSRAFPEVSANWALNSLSPLSGTLDIQAKEADFSLKLPLKFDKALSLNGKEGAFSASINSARFDALRGFLKRFYSPNTPLHELLLRKPLDLNVKVESLNIPFNGLLSSKSSIKASLAIESLDVFSPADKQQILLNNLYANIDSQEIGKHLKFSLTAKEAGEKENPLAMTGNIKNLLTDAGSFNESGLFVDFAAKAKSLPANLLCIIDCVDNTLKEKLVAVLGKTFETDINVSLKRSEGTLSAYFKGDNGRISFEGKIQESFLTLKTPFEVEVKVTPELNATILDELIPILGGALSAEQPLKISIDPQGFSLYLKDLKPANFSAENVVVNLGKMTFSYDSPIGNILGLLKEKPADKITVWFTPLYIQASRGIFTLQRMDMLAMNRYPFAMWGDVNFLKDKVNLKVGISGATLEKAVGIRGLSKDYMMQLPFKGPIGKAGIDKAAAGAKIGALIASAAGQQGKVVGAFLNLASGALTETSPPPPTTSPLPWEDLLHTTPMPSDTQESKPSSSQPKKSKKTNLFEDAASSIIQEILK